MTTVDRRSKLIETLVAYGFCFDAIRDLSIASLEIIAKAHGINVG